MDTLSVVITGKAISSLVKQQEVNNLYSNEKPYTMKKRAVVCNLVRNIIQSDITGRVSALGQSAKEDKKKSLQPPRIVFTPGQNSRESTPPKEGPQEPKSEASTPKNAALAKLFSSRRQSHGSLKVDNAIANPSKEKGKVIIKNITVKRATSLVPENGKTSSKCNSSSSSKESDSKKPQQVQEKNPTPKATVATPNSTSEYSTTSGSFVKFNDAISQEREKIIQYNKLCNLHSCL